MLLLLVVVAGCALCGLVNSICFVDAHAVNRGWGGLGGRGGVIMFGKRSHAVNGGARRGAVVTFGKRRTGSQAVGRGGVMMFGKRRKRSQLAGGERMLGKTHARSQQGVGRSGVRW